MRFNAEAWLAKPGVVAVIRLLHALFFLGASAYCFLSYSPFAYAQFIKPNVVPALTEFVMLSQWYFWVIFLTTLLTLMPQLRGGRGRWAAIGYVSVWSILGAIALFKPPLRAIGNGPLGFAFGLIALVPPVWLAVIDHRAQPAAALRSTAPSRALKACLLAAAVAWVTYSIATPLRLGQTSGIELTRGGLTIALASSMILDLYCFMALFLALAAVISLASLSRSQAAVEYWLFVSLLGASTALVLYLLVCAAITFTGWDAAAASAALGVALAAIWADLARLRSKPLFPAPSPQLDSLAVFCAPIAGVKSRRAALAVVLLMPAVAYVLIDAVSHFDWNFLLQKLTVLIVWLATFSAVYAARSANVDRLSASGWNLGWRFSVVPMVAFVLYHAFVSVEARGSVAPTDPARAARDARLSPRVVLDRYAAIDPSFHLIRDARKARSSETAEYYAFLRAHTLVPFADIPALDVDFVKPLRPAAQRKPDIYIFIVDSMRRDYLAPYNAKVTFTPAIGQFGRESLVFDRAFTRYAGTALAVPSIWAGAMMPHSLEQPEFGRRNTLLKLLDANHYLRVMNIDHIIGDLVPADPNLVQLDKGKGTMQFDVCTTVGELETKLTEADPSRPVFLYTLPQNVHISIASRRKVPDGESYPGFFAPVASSVHRIDGCFGGFIDFLKRTNRYDNSVVILTSDHGDSLGEEGRWGHAHFIVPEVMRIPLIVHLPSWLRSHVSYDLSALTFSADITPSLYALLGYEPATRGSLFGHPAFGPPAADSEWRRRMPYLLASSYGTVYATLRQNGRRLYVVDAVDGRDNAFDISDDAVGERVEVTQAMTAENRLLIREQLTELARQNHYPPRP